MTFNCIAVVKLVSQVNWILDVSNNEKSSSYANKFHQTKATANCWIISTATPRSCANFSWFYELIKSLLKAKISANSREGSDLMNYAATTKLMSRSKRNQNEIKLTRNVHIWVEIQKLKQAPEDFAAADDNFVRSRQIASVDEFDSSNFCFKLISI